ncbi:MAG: peptidylprolyl isomerase [Acidimicrobiia bacterium]
MPKATKRERQRINRELRREAIRKAEQRRRRFRTARNLAIPIGIVAIIFGVIRLTQGDDDTNSSAGANEITCTNKKPESAASTQQFSEPPPLTIDPAQQYTAVMDTSCGKINIALDAAQAPQTVNSFVFLAQQGIYNGTLFHRIVTNFVDQGGDPKGDGTGGPGYQLPDEPPADGYKAGTVAMANAGTGTTGSQFFLTVSKQGAQTLGSGGAPYKYSILGQMDAQGLKIAKKINTFGASDEAGTPTKKIYVFSVTIESGASTTTPAATTTTAAP